MYLAAAGLVSVRVYDAGGRLVRTLVDAPMSASAHSVTWRGDDAGGRRVASGVYCCVLQTAEGRGVRRLTLIR
jgi:flagellar hook assembly protein FlgD